MKGLGKLLLLGGFFLLRSKGAKATVPGAGAGGGGAGSPDRKSVV